VRGLERGERVIVSDPAVAVAGMEVAVNERGAIAARSD
jgi:hypothetical protein